MRFVVAMIRFVAIAFLVFCMCAPKLLPAPRTQTKRGLSGWSMGARCVCVLCLGQDKASNCHAKTLHTNTLLGRAWAAIELCCLDLLLQLKVISACSCSSCLSIAQKTTLKVAAWLIMVNIFYKYYAYDMLNQLHFIIYPSVLNHSML